MDRPVGEKLAEFRVYLRQLPILAQREFAMRTGVSLRTVQRWAIPKAPGRESREYIPTRLQNINPGDWKPEYRKRYNRLNLLIDALYRAPLLADEERSFSERFRSLYDAMRYASEVVAGNVSAWLAYNWTEVSIVQGFNEWIVVIKYASIGAEYKFTVKSISGGNVGSTNVLEGDEFGIAGIGDLDGDFDEA